MELKIELWPNFNNMEELTTEKMRQNPASYRKSTNTIYINDSTFFVFDILLKKAFIAHEIGHAVLRDASPLIVNVNGTDYELSEEIRADWLACEWGFFEDLKKDRLLHHGQQYVDLLAGGMTFKGFNRNMIIWQLTH